MPLSNYIEKKRNEFDQKAKRLARKFTEQAESQLANSLAISPSLVLADVFAFELSKLDFASETIAAEFYGCDYLGPSVKCLQEAAVEYSQYTQLSAEPNETFYFEIQGVTKGYHIVYLEYFLETFRKEGYAVYFKDSRIIIVAYVPH